MICVNDRSEEFRAQVASVCAGSPFGAYIESYMDAYRARRYPFAEFWLHKEHGTLKAAFCRYYDTVIFCGESSEEAESFSRMLSPRALLCGAAEHFKLDGMRRETGEVMRFSGDKALSVKCPSGYEIKLLRGDIRPLREVYKLLLGAFSNIHSGGEDDFCADISHKLRHGAARVYAVCKGGETVSALTVSAVSNTAAVISAAATREDFRGRGLAGYVLSTACEELTAAGIEVFLLRDHPIPLYEKLGFETVGAWAQYTRGEFDDI